MNMEQPTGAQTEITTRDIAKSTSPTNHGSTTREDAGAAAAVAESAKETAKEVTHHAAEQAQDVTHEARQQVASLWGQTRTELDAQLEGRREHAATTLRTLSDELGALGEGRTSDAPMVVGYLSRGRERVDSMANRLEQRSASELLGEVAAFARRRPGAFLGGAIVLGYVAGRAVKVGASSNKAPGNGHAANHRPEWATSQRPSAGHGSDGNSPARQGGLSASGSAETMGQSGGFMSATPSTDSEPINPPLGVAQDPTRSSDYLAGSDTEPRR
jgi:hypothetical protein